MKNKTIAFVIFLFFLISTLYGQLGMGNGRIHGVISDKSGKPLTGVKVLVKNLIYKNIVESISDDSGHWSVSGLASGHYLITVTSEGYQKEQISFRISFASKRVHTLDIELVKIQPKKPTSKPTEGREPKVLTQLLNEGNALYNQEKYEEATVKFEQYVEQHPELYQVYSNIGNCHRQTKDYEKALVAYNTFLEKTKKDKGSLEGDKDAARVLATMGELYLIKSDIEKAKECFKQAVDIFPEDEILAYNVGEIFFQQGQADLAIEYLKIAIKIKEDWDPPYLKIGYAYTNRGMYQQAVDSFKKFLELAPDDPGAPALKNLIPQLEKLAKKKK